MTRLIDVSAGTKRCADCKAIKRLSEFYPSKINKHGYYSYCKSCQTARNQIWLSKNPGRCASQQRKLRHANRDRYLDYTRKYKYGLQSGEYATILASQGNKCAICKTENSGSKRGFHIDHCQKTRKIRGLLCVNCNLGIGSLKHDLDILESAIRYLRP